MAAADVQAPPADPAPGLPDYVLDSDAVLKDIANWRYGRAPDYSKTRKMFQETKRMSHEAGSLPDLVQNLVKNWEVEASFKPSLSDWRTIDPANYSFAINGSDPQTAEHMLKVGTYNAIISPNEYYSPEYSDFGSSHKTFKRMMPTFAWEVLEVYSGPPEVAFRWRHWGVMKSDYVGFNNKGEKVTAKSHGGPIDIQGITVATVDDKLRLQNVRTWFDPMDMFRQIAPDGVVRKDAVDKKLTPDEAIDSERKAEIEQKPRPVDAPTTTLPDRSKEATTGSEAEKLVEATGCPFAGTDPEEAVRPFVHPTGAEHVTSRPSSTDAREWSEVSNAEGADAPAESSRQGSGGCPFNNNQE